MKLFADEFSKFEKKVLDADPKQDLEPRHLFASGGMAMAVFVAGQLREAGLMTPEIGRVMDPIVLEAGLMAAPGDMGLASFHTVAKAH